VEPRVASTCQLNCAEEAIDTASEKKLFGDAPRELRDLQSASSARVIGRECLSTYVSLEEACRG
jgi:hypothetical protein